MWIKGATDVGKRRSTNQDCFRAGTFKDGGYILVCDGMGGENGGNVASKITADIIEKYITENISVDMREGEVRNELAIAGARANEEVFNMASNKSELKGMGSTISGIVFTKNTAHVIHAGDSRIYMLRENDLGKITTDHTVVEMLLQRGDISLEEAKNHPKRNYITRAVGAEKEIKFDIFTLDVKKDDVFLLCSDGMYNCISEEEMCRILPICLNEKSPNPLINKANINGGFDNITAVICRI